MIRVLTGDKAIRFADMEARVRECESVLRAAREKYRSAQAGWITTSALLESALQREGQLIAELEEAQAALDVALQACIDRERRLEGVEA